MRQIKYKTELMLEVETKLGGHIEEILRKMYVDDNKSVKDIANQLGISYVTVIRWLNYAGIYSRKIRASE